MIAIVRQDFTGLVGPVTRDDRSNRRCNPTAQLPGLAEIPAMASGGFFRRQLAVSLGIRNAHLDHNRAFVGDHRPLHLMVVTLVMLVLVTSRFIRVSDSRGGWTRNPINASPPGPKTGPIAEGSRQPGRMPALAPYFPRPRSVWLDSRRPARCFSKITHR